MTVKILDSNGPLLREAAQIRQIRGSAKILLGCEDDSMLDVTIVDPGNSVIVRDKDLGVKYLG